MSRLMELWSPEEGAAADPYVVQVKRNLWPALVEKLSRLITGEGCWELWDCGHPIIVHGHGRGPGSTYHHIELVTLNEPDGLPRVVPMPKREVDLLVTEVKQLIATNQRGNSR